MCVCVCVCVCGSGGETQGSQGPERGACSGHVTENQGPDRTLASLCIWETETLGEAETDTRSPRGDVAKVDLNSAMLVLLSYLGN